ncbi:aminoglycoside phosphotransferase [Nakamurella antarctica]|uniref:Maltokinase n=1 Tax=Nakamurella antarctica TaxID=1902245 RepID=A0A3G8ZKK7_9ACTN|nr:aminoglycoside phosphotransferase [Nakamurella antarctica]AZI57849.1 aminoglycoside phosphotransferase [Nakamurella antarctica]
MTETTSRLPLDDPALLDLISSWLPHQRWFAGKGGQLGPISIEARAALDTPEWDAGDAADMMRVEHLILRVYTNVGEQMYQLFLGWRHTVSDRLQHSVIGSIGNETVYDALHDAAVSSQLLSRIHASRTWGPITLAAEVDSEFDATAPGLVISGEQSNTSIIFGDTSILKVFRRIEPGQNPDVEIHRALKVAGSKHVAAPQGVLEADVAGVPTTLGFMASFFANSADGWAMACASVRDLLAEGDLRADEVGGDFAAEAHRLGEAVAHVHTDLAAAFGTDHVDASQWQTTLDAMISEARAVAAYVSSVAEHLDGIIATFEAARHVGSAATRQRIHGDLHLGQTLRTLTGWVIIDFEGEPAKPMVERRAKHLLAKDLAGMLRSLDYAAHHLLPGGASDAQQTYRAGEWATRNRHAFLAGYEAVAGEEQLASLHEKALIRAYELDKAVYEVAYEHGNRPSWEPIPLHAIATLIKAGGNA